MRARFRNKSNVRRSIARSHFQTTTRELVPFKAIKNMSDNGTVCCRQFFRGLEKPRSRMSARNYALHIVCLQLSYSFSYGVVFRWKRSTELAEQIMPAWSMLWWLPIREPVNLSHDQIGTIRDTKMTRSSLAHRSVRTPQCPRLCPGATGVETVFKMLQGPRL